MASVLLEVKGLHHHFKNGKNHVIHAVKDVSFQLYENEFIGLVGESGSGKSTTGKCLLQMYKPTAGVVHYQGLELTNPKVYQANRHRLCSELQMVFQDSASAMNPRMTVAQIIAEPLLLQKRMKDKRELSKKVSELMALVELDENLLSRHPYECSGGQRQRIGIARAICLEPKLLIADEPIASLDLPLQVQIVTLLKKLQESQKLSCILITHDLQMALKACDRLAVMQAGRIVEIEKTSVLRHEPKHAYTKSLLDAILTPEV